MMDLTWRILNHSRTSGTCVAVGTVPGLKGASVYIHFYRRGVLRRPWYRVIYKIFDHEYTTWYKDEPVDKVQSYADCNFKSYALSALDAMRATYQDLVPRYERLLKYLEDTKWIKRDDKRKLYDELKAYNLA